MTHHVWCPSLIPLYFALYLRQIEGKAVKVVSHHKSVLKFCDHLGVPTLAHARPMLGRNFFQNCGRLKRCEQDMRQRLRENPPAPGDAFLLLGSVAQIIYIGATLARLHAGRCQVFRHDLIEPDLKAAIQPAPFSLARFRDPGYRQMLSVALSAKLVQGLDLHVCKQPQKYALAIDDRFFASVGAAPLDFSLSPPVLKQKLLDHLAPSWPEDHDALVVDFDTAFWWKAYASDPAGVGFMQELFGQVFAMLERAGLDYALKVHPDIEEKPHLMGEVTLPPGVPQFPAFIPSEFLYRNVRRAVVGVSSATLVGAAKSGRLTAISLMDLAPWRDTNLRDSIRTYLVRESEDKILFVRSVDELRQAIAGLARA